MRTHRSATLPLLLCVLTLLAGCRGVSAGKAVELASDGPCAVALTPHQGGERVDADIARLQQKARDLAAKSADPLPHLEQLGWKFVEKARLSYDPGYYKLAEQCAACIETRQASQNPQNQTSHEAMLLRGHVLHSLHRFKEAEEIARKLASKRGIAFDFGLLGDALMEQGKLGDAVVAYQKMLDLKPGLQSYSRAAHVRWLKGDLEGAIELMRLAAGAASPNDADSAAWAYARLSNYELQAGNRKSAAAACDAAITMRRDYAPGLLVCSRVMMAEGRDNIAISLLQRAAELDPLPEYQWALSDALRAAKREDEARKIESKLVARGEADDPRTFALYLATRGEQIQKAVSLTESELKVRNDVFTLDAHAWALAAAGRFDEAHTTIQRALAEGTREARLFLHAAVISAHIGATGQARQYLKQATELQCLLLPSEKERLRQLKL